MRGQNALCKKTKGREGPNNTKQIDGLMGAVYNHLIAQSVYIYPECNQTTWLSSNSKAMEMIISSAQKEEWWMGHWGEVASQLYLYFPRQKCLLRCWCLYMPAMVTALGSNLKLSRHPLCKWQLTEVVDQGASGLRVMKIKNKNCRLHH